VKRPDYGNHPHARSEWKAQACAIARLQPSGMSLRFMRPLEAAMLEGLFQPFHLIIILFIAVLSWGMPFLAGYFLGRYMERKKLRP
jgi:hypothetical protein